MCTCIVGLSLDFNLPSSFKTGSCAYAIGQVRPMGMLMVFATKTGTRKESMRCQRSSWVIRIALYRQDLWEDGGRGGGGGGCCGAAL